MKCPSNQKSVINFDMKFLPFFIFILFACATMPIKSYEEIVSQWRSHKDVERWMGKDFSFDRERFKKYEGTSPLPRTPEETFELKSGISIDAAIFANETLNRINPSYQAKIVVLFFQQGANYYVCSFKIEGKLFIMDYGTPFRKMAGVHGPFHSLEEYKIFFEKHHPVIQHVQGITYLQ